MDDEKFMKLAIDKAREGVDEGQTPFGACIVKDGKVVVCVHNVVWATMDITAHAEVHAIRQACGELGTINLEGCEIYATCEPCPMCFSAIHWSRISRIVYGARIADAKEIGFHELEISNQRMKEIGRSSVELVGDVLREEAIELFRYWREKNGSRKY
ncbi:MAG: nucleoside deaminase [Phycisphaerae bacterium]|nr:nucleoside deaminase [Phycisphaerae bacterium]